MPTLKYLGNTYDCATAIKGSDYIHLLDENGVMVASFDGISNFTGFTLSNGSYTSPTADHDCYLAIIRDDGTIGKGGHKCSDIPTSVAKEDHKHSAADITSGLLPIARGGTAKSTWIADRLVYYGGSAFGQVKFPTAAKSVLRQDTSGAPYWTDMNTLAAELGVGGSVSSGAYQGEGGNRVTIGVPSGTKMLLVIGECYNEVTGEISEFCGPGVFYPGQKFGVGDYVQATGAVENCEICRDTVKVNFQNNVCILTGATDGFIFDREFTTYTWFAFS